MNDKIKEKLALHRIVFASGIFSLIGLVSWTYQSFSIDITSQFWERFILTLFFLTINIIYYKKINKIIEKIK